MLVSKEYVALLRHEHDTTQWGTTAGRWAHEVGKWCLRRGYKNVLDYGCGKGTLRPALAEFGIPVLEYDPGIEGKETVPGPADAVVCLDVLEHIEPEYLDAVLAHMNGLATKAIFAVIALYQGGRTLADGRPAHLIVEDQDWWKERIARHWTGTLKWDYRPVPGRNPAKRARDCLVVTMERAK